MTCRTLVLLGLLAAAATADDLTVVLDGDDALTPAGATMDTVFSLGAAGDDAWSGWVRTDPNDFLVMQSGAIVQQEHQPIPHVDGVFAGDTHVDIDGQGRALYRGFVVPNSGAPSYEAAFRANQVLLVEGDPVGGDAFPPGAYYARFRTVHGSSSSKVLVRATVRWHGGTADALVVLDVDAAGAIVDREVVLKTGDPVGDTVFESFMPGAGIFLDGRYHDIDGSGRVASIVRLDGPDDGAVWVDGEIVAREGQPSPFDGAPWRSFVAGDVALNDAGDVAYKGWLDAPYLFDDAIVCNGLPLIRETLPVPGLPDTAITILNEPRLDERGRVLWWCGYTDRFGGSGVALVRDDQLVAYSGLQLGPGGDRIASVGSEAAVSPNRSRALVFFETTDGEEVLGWFEKDAAVVDLHGGLVGSAGTPRIDVWGLVAPDNAVHVMAHRAVPHAQAFVVVGRSIARRPLFGGVLVPSPDLVFPVVTDPEGRLAVGGPWPANVPPGAELAVQLWVADPGAAEGFSASNTLAISPLP